MIPEPIEDPFHVSIVRDAPCLPFSGKKRAVFETRISRIDKKNGPSVFFGSDDASGGLEDPVHTLSLIHI